MCFIRGRSGWIGFLGGVVCLFGLTQTSHAQFGPFKDLIDKVIPPIKFPDLPTKDVIPQHAEVRRRAGLDHSDIYIKNETDRELEVAVHYMPFENGVRFNGWKTKAWYKLKPGQEAFLFQTHNGIFYVHAHDQSMENTWGDSEKGEKFLVGNEPPGDKEPMYPYAFRVCEFKVFTDKLTVSLTLKP